VDQDEGPVVADEAMRNLYRMAERVAQGRISVLILGETGVGKELFAEAIHRGSPRRRQPFVKLNCAAISEALLESELFGHERGAFTGAEQAKPGLLEVASGGTVFLDEVGELSMATQAKLLRAIEQRQVLRVGSLQPRDLDVRFVSATNRDPEAQIRAGLLREDLFYRLEGVTLRIPPLRERRQEIAPLAQAFLRRGADELGLEVVPALSPRAEALLVGYDWPGNIRELRNVIDRALLLAWGDVVEPEHLPLDKLQATWRTAPGPARPGRGGAGRGGPGRGAGRHRGGPGGGRRQPDPGGGAPGDLAPDPLQEAGRVRAPQAAQAELTNGPRNRERGRGEVDSSSLSSRTTDGAPPGFIQGSGVFHLGNGASFARSHYVLR
jgi:two-component system response regulator AtoC